MSRPLTISMLALTLVALAAATASADERWTWELRSGADFGSTTLDGTDLGTGGGFETAFTYRLQPHLSAYAGWGWHHLGAGDQFADGSLEQTGYTFGLQFLHPVGSGPFSLFARGGTVLRHFELEAGDDVLVDSGHGWGYELGGGLAFAIDPTWSLRLGVTHRALDREISVDDRDVTVESGGLAIEVGMARSF